MEIRPDAFPGSLVGLANFAILLILLTAGIVFATVKRLDRRIGIFGGVMIWFSHLMSPDQVRLVNFFVLAISIAAGSAAMSGAGYGIAAGRKHSPEIWLLATLNLFAASLVCWVSCAIPLLAFAGVCHIIGVALMAKDIHKFLARTISGIGSIGPAVGAIIVLAIFGVIYMPVIWPAWTFVHGGIFAASFLIAYYTNKKR
jgi:hypothetical protein